MVICCRCDEIFCQGCKYTVHYHTWNHIVNWLKTSWIWNHFFSFSAKYGHGFQFISVDDCHGTGKLLCNPYEVSLNIPLLLGEQPFMAVKKLPVKSNKAKSEKPTDQPISQPINRSIDQPSERPTDRLTNKSTNRFAYHITKQSRIHAYPSRVRVGRGHIWGH